MMIFKGIEETKILIRKSMKSLLTTHLSGLTHKNWE